MERASDARRGGGLGWAAIAAFVTAWDVAAPETLSHAFVRGTENPYSRPFVVGALAVTAAHLMQLIPEQLDPFKQVFNYFGAED